ITNLPKTQQPYFPASQTNVKSSKIATKSISKSETREIVKPVVENNNYDNIDDKLNEKVKKIAETEDIIEEEEIFVVNLTEEEEREEGIVAEWLLGTCLIYKSVRNHSSLVQNEKIELQKTDSIDNVTTGNNFVQI